MHFTDHNQLLSQTELYNSTLQITLQNKFCLLTLKKKTKNHVNLLSAEDWNIWFLSKSLGHRRPLSLHQGADILTQASKVPEGLPTM